MFEYNFPDLPIICKYDYQYNYRGELRSKPIYALLTDYDKETRKYCAIRMLEDGKAFGRHDVTWMYWAKEDILKYQVGMDELPPKVMASVKEHLQMEEEIQERQRKRLQRMLQSLKIVEVTDRTANILNQILEIWEDAVKATHLFLSDEEIMHIKQYVPQALQEVRQLFVAVTEERKPLAFMGAEDGKLEMLFVTPKERSKGIGKLLFTYGIKNCGINCLTVNEQNPQAIGFYEHMGFQTYKRTDMDEQGNPYPLLYMRLGQKKE